MSVEPLKESHQNLSFQKSKNPKIPTQVSDFWKLEEFAQNPKKPKIPRVSKNPKIPFRIFGNSRNLLKIQKNPKFLEFSKNPKIPTPVSGKLGIFGFLDFWKLEEFWVFLDFEQIPRVSKNPKLGLGFLDFWIFGNSRNFGFFWSKFLEFPKMKHSRNFGFFWILSKFLEFPKIRNLGWDFLDFWIFENSRNFLFPKIRGFLDF